MTHDDGYLDDYQATFSFHSCCNHDPGLELHRLFGGEHWLLETKVTTFMPYANGRWFDLRVYFGDGGPNTFSVDFRTIRDVNQLHIRTLLRHKFGPNLEDITTLEALSPPFPGGLPIFEFPAFGPDFITVYWRLERAGSVLTAMYSPDGVTWSTAFSRDMGTQLDGLGQRVVLAGLSWFVPADSYADYDYVQVTETQPPDLPPCMKFLFLAEKDVEIDRPLVVDGDIHANDDIKLNHASDDGKRHDDDDDDGKRHDDDDDGKRHNGGPSTYTGNLTAVDDIRIRKANTIEGDVTAGGRVKVSHSSTVTGTISEHAAVEPIPLPTPAFAADGSDVTVPPHSALALDPGSYGEVEVKRRGTLFLRTGEYFLKSLETKRRSTISIDVTDGPVTINVARKLAFGPKTEVLITPSGEAGTEEVTFTSKQTHELEIQRGARVLGTTIAPHARVEALSHFTFKGSMCAKNIEVERGATLLHHSSSMPLP